VSLHAHEMESANVDRCRNKLESFHLCLIKKTTKACFKINC